MKILITTGLFPPDIGGPATYVPRVAEALADRGHDVTVVAPQDRGVTGPIIASYSLVRFYRADFLRYINFFVELWRAFVTVLREARACDVMFVNGLDLPSTLVARLTGKPMVVKVVGDGAWEIAHNRGWTTLNVDEFQKVRGLRIGFFRLMLHTAAKRARAVIAPSRYLARIVEGWGVPGERICVVYNALSEPAASNNELPLPEGFDTGFRLLMIGRMIPLKRMEQVISILTYLDGAKLVIVGDGPSRGNLLTQATCLGLGERVFFTGRISQSDVWALLRDYADVFVLNSVHETFPHVLIEAAQCGVPVVATAVGGVPEIVQDGETGLLISPDSPSELLAALERLRADSILRQRLASNSRQVTARFSPEQMIAETEQVLFQSAVG
jgi:glycosyltransferase involved in cell wall biosynthesis